MHVLAHTRALAKQTHTSQSRFLLQLFISPWHFEACSCLPVSLPPQTPLSSLLPLLFHFMHSYLPSTFLSMCLNPGSTESVIKYFIMSQ